MGDRGRGREGGLALEVPSIHCRGGGRMCVCRGVQIVCPYLPNCEHQPAACASWRHLAQTFPPPASGGFPSSPLPPDNLKRLLYISSSAASLKALSGQASP